MAFPSTLSHTALCPLLLWEIIPSHLSKLMLVESTLSVCNLCVIYVSCLLELFVNIGIATEDSLLKLVCVDGKKVRSTEWILKQMTTQLDTFLFWLDLWLFCFAGNAFLSGILLSVTVFCDCCHDVERMPLVPGAGIADSTDWYYRCQTS